MRTRSAIAAVSLLLPAMGLLPGAAARAAVTAELRADSDVLDVGQSTTVRLFVGNVGAAADAGIQSVSVDIVPSEAGVVVASLPAIWLSPLNDPGSLPTLAGSVAGDGGIRAIAASGPVFPPITDVGLTAPVEVLRFTVTGVGNGTIDLNVRNYNGDGYRGILTWASELGDDADYVGQRIRVGPPPGVVQLDAAAYSVARDAGSLLVTITRTDGTAAGVRVSYATSDGTGRADTDYTATAGTVTFGDGETTQTFSVPILNHLYIAGDRTVHLMLSDPTGGATLGETATAVLTIIDNQPPPTLTVSDAAAPEGNSGTSVLSLPVTLSRPCAQAASVQYATVDGTAQAGADYIAAGGTLVIPAGETTGAIAVTIKGDTIYESDETFQIALHNPIGAALDAAAAQGTIQNDDAMPAVSIGDALITESSGGSGSMSFPVTLSHTSAYEVRVDYATSDGTATAGADYVAAAGTLTVAPGATAGTIEVTVIGDALYEANESLSVVLSGAAGATIADGQALGTILDNDAPPAISIDDARGSGNELLFHVRLSAASGLPATVAFTTLDGTAVAGRDYTAASGTVHIPAGQTEGTIAVPIQPGSQARDFRVRLSWPTDAELQDSEATGTIEALAPQEPMDPQDPVDPQDPTEPTEPGEPEPPPAGPSCGMGIDATNVLGFHALALLGLGAGKGFIPRRRRSGTTPADD